MIHDVWPDTPPWAHVVAFWVVFVVVSMVGISVARHAVNPRYWPVVPYVGNRVAWQPTRDGGYIGCDQRGNVYQVGPRMGGWRWEVEELTIFGAVPVPPACRSWTPDVARAKFDRFIREEATRGR